MTISLVVILFELTGALSHVLPIMICVMTSKWVGDALGTDGIYAVWIAMRRYPWLPPVDYRDMGQTGANLMKPVEQLTVIEDNVLTIHDLDGLLKESDFYGYPVISRGKLVGYVARDKLRLALEPLMAVDANTSESTICSFSQNIFSQPPTNHVDLSGTLEEAVLQLRKEVPQELIVSMFQKLNLRQILFTHSGKLTGIVTKTDVVSLLTSHFPHAAALAQKPRPPE